MRINHIWTNSEDIKETGYTYVLCKNLLKHFVAIADLKIQIMGYIYGTSAGENVKEIKCIVIVPQIGTRDSVTLPKQMPESEYLKNMEPLGWIHTQSEEKNQLSIQDCLQHSKFLENSNWGVDKTVVLTVAFTPGSISLTSYRLTPSGFEWGRTRDSNPSPATYNTGFF